jgi:molecular chaperone GrpE
MAENVNDSESREPAPDDETQGETRTAAATEDPVQAIRQERDALQDRLLRTAAEFDNYRKRIERERRDLAEFAASDVMLELLPIVDNFERALQAAAPPGAESYRAGIEMIHKQMLDLLRKRGVKPIEALGADFDPNFHQAVIHEASADHRDGEVMQELQRGYMLGERLLRPAMVKVAKSS